MTDDLNIIEDDGAASKTRTWPWIVFPTLLALALLAAALGPDLVLMRPPAGEPVLSVDLSKSDPLPTNPLPDLDLVEATLDEEALIDVSREEAKTINAAVPLSDVPVVAASPFASGLEDADRDRARTCLAIAAIYEAGSDPGDQMPVMQVVLNRVRHPAFPNSVCDVVFQGSERSTGCQFSFTCDGSMTRTRPPESTLAKAKGLAEYMLVEGVDDRVGHATHYHTDWVVPYWSAKLNKVTKVGTHIFLSWPGGWGQKRAFNAAPSAAEGMVAQLANYSLAHSGEEGRIELDAEEWADLNALDPDFLTGELAGAPSGGGSAAAAPARKEFVIPTKTLTFSAGMTPGRWSLDAAGACGDLPACRVVGWSDPARSPGQVTPGALAGAPPDLVFVQDLRNRVQTAYWDCGKWTRAGTSKCLGSASDTVALVNGSKL
ncbi:MAG: cell wall hydrolase [Pseudomonadota bacterium]